MIDKADILIVTVTEVESRAVKTLFREATGTDPKPVSIGDRVYLDLGALNGTRAYMAISGMGAGGVGGAQENVRKGIEALSPKAVIMVGIAFGIDEEKQAIGDILVSERLLLYDLQRAGTTKSGGFEIIPRGDRPHASPWLIDRFRMANLSWTGAKVRTGLVLTGDKLVDNLDFRDQLHSLEREAIGGEMEGAGLYVACQNAKVDWILVKAICDWADGEKEKDRVGRQALAAGNAAAFVVHGLGFVGRDSANGRHFPEVPTSFKSYLEELIGYGEVEEAINSLKEHAQQNGSARLRQQVMQLSERWATYSRSIHMGVITHSNAEVERNRIVNALIYLISSI